MSFAAFIEICEEDGWLTSQLTAEVERLDMPFAVHFDRCGDELKDRLRKHPLCVGSVHQDSLIEYTEQHKQAVFDLLATQHRWHWLIQWNIDEIWEKDAPEKLRAVTKMHPKPDYLQVQWVNCWGDLEHVRVDGQFEKSLRVKLYNVSGDQRWYFDHPITHGCKLVGVSREATLAVTDLVCLHTGLMTRKLREQHKARWDRIYSKAVGNNPYHFWNYCLDEENYPPVITANTYR